MILTWAEYKEVNGSDITEDDFNRLYRHAYRDLDGLTFNRITARGYDNLTTFQQELVKACLVAQMEFRNTYGAMMDLNVAGYSAGSTSVQFNGAVLYQNNGIYTTPAIQHALKQTGLMVQIP